MRGPPRFEARDIRPHGSAQPHPLLARYLDSEEQVLQQYARYALNYFDAALRARVVPGREPLRGGVM